MRKSILLIVAVIFVGCAQSNEETLLQGSRHGHRLNISHTEPSAIEADRQHQPLVRVTQENLEFKTPRQLKHERPLRPGALTLPADQIEKLAMNQAVQLFPELQFRISNIRQGRAFSYVELQQTHQERPVFGAKLLLELDAKGDWAQAKSTLVSSELLAQIVDTPDVSKSLDQVPSELVIVKNEAIIYPYVQNEVAQLHLARQLEVYSPNGNNAFILFTSETSGEVLGVYHPEQRFQGELELTGSILPNAPGDEPLRTILPMAVMEIGEQKVQADWNGVFDLSQIAPAQAILRLKNPWISVVNNAGDDNILRLDLNTLDQPVLDMDPHSLIDERNIYYWVMVAHDFLRTKLDFHEMDFFMVGMARDGTDLDNAYFNPLFSMVGAPVLAFGTGKTLLKNTAQSRDIVLHEFGHAITWKIYGMKANYEFSAMNEGFSDYFAATVTGDPAIADGAMVKLPFLRNVENNLVYPKDYNGQYFHQDSQLFSGALWQIRKALGDYADVLIHEARLAQADTVVEFYTKLLELDDALDPNRDDRWSTLSPNFQTIRKAFSKHGIHALVKFNQGEPEDLTLPWKTQANCWDPREAQPGL